MTEQDWWVSLPFILVAMGFIAVFLSECFCEWLAEKRAVVKECRMDVYGQQGRGGDFVLVSSKKIDPRSISRMVTYLVLDPGLYYRVSFYDSSETERFCLRLHTRQEEKEEKVEQETVVVEPTKQPRVFGRVLRG